ncbi:F-box protein At5g52880 isoform X4 [Cryptomeria japonica]|uniref:F-box protein At5g52880 isoform X4 n=1 Tax=Cryptomeria japonica TaxID=3369 RepID=UPI0025AC8E13|nr:F-box protein At5g52880 isoform X4 [Cryptomeria japonica]
MSTFLRCFPRDPQRSIHIWINPIKPIHGPGYRFYCFRWDYVEACKELAVILRGAYSKVPKNLQALMFQDTLAAFRLLPGADTSQRILAANLLLQAAEASLPKQKKALAITEFKHAAVALRRHSKFRHQEADPLQLTNDVLVHIFGFLDVRSLVSTGLVCRYWNLASKDNTLWQAKYQLHFDTCLPNDAHRKKSMNNALDDKVGSHNQNLQRLELGVHTDWYEAFKIAFEVSYYRASIPCFHVK